jgi:7,8-dihydroneopterin aldolase/epimerase/oxygenase
MQSFAMDRIFIEGLRLDCRIGVTEDERRLSQKVLVDVSLFLDLRRPAASGRVEHTADYREAKRQISQFVAQGEFRLLESLAEGVASLVLGGFDAKRVAVRVRKEKYSAEPSIGIEIERAREA